MSNEKMRNDAYAAFVADDEKQGWCARSFFNAGYQAALAHVVDPPASQKPFAYWFEAGWGGQWQMARYGKPTGKKVTRVETLYSSPPDYEATKRHVKILETKVDHFKDCVDALKSENEALKAENERLTKCLSSANASAEKFEREWYLRGDAVDELTSENKALRQRVAELEADKEKTKAEVLKYVEEVESALRKAKGQK